MNKNRFSKFIIWAVIVLNIAFTISVLYIFLKTGSEPATLIGCWFGFTTGELWMLASIKKTKVTKKDLLKDQYITQMKKNKDGVGE